MTAQAADPTVFERIAAREIPATIVAETERVIAFRDIAPQAPVHVVVTPKQGRYRDVVELAAGDPGLLAELVEVARGVADELADGQFRLIFNTGAGAGQTVFHVHAHVLAGGLEERTLAG
ncbi:histidine triad nucleotide-binding protein [Agromyces mediolanus]|jgi:histidine triad (HIT) family protein|uniref:Histidine triad nucleotide-binding protein n=2 Tax=Agromyces TaxID=33877 RepID=A0A918FGE9_AGRME|nr:MULTISPECIES: histidine triad nucleotide-binding protein [Agromyces]MCD1572188.1 histidine triad nucleotide-binding protein [Agromyces mediolanus]UOE25618.1 histidine triad nucleotide-binding protein [Agromyces soli]GGR36129.1 histidine triad nucleotide-binding protein [Agromyces mediolanus]GLJ72859.1 histidine triad nucleotide-binding protein [Agromyces mediolanus]